MSEPNFEDLADTMTASYRTMRYVETNMNQFTQTLQLLQMCAVIITCAVLLLLVRKVVTTRK